MATTTPDISGQWKALSPDQREKALSRMTPEQKQKLATSLGFKGPTTENTAPREPGLLEPHGKWGVGDLLRGGVAGIVNPIIHPIDTAKSAGQPFQATGASVGGGYPGTLTSIPGSKTGAAAAAQNAEAQAGAAKETAEQGREMAKHPP